MQHYIKHKSKWCEIESILQLINKIAKMEVVKTTKYSFLKYFENNMDCNFYVFCSNKECRRICKIKSGSETKKFTCANDECETVTCVENVEVAFVTFGLELQLRQLLEKHKNVLIFPKSDHDEFPITDVWSGNIHRKIMKATKKAFVSLTLNTDGVQVFNSSSKLLWPIILSVNNLPLEMRFNQDNLIVAGFHMSNELDMATFLESLILEVKSLNSKGGIDLSFGKFEVFCPLSSLDAPAKSKVQNMAQFNGYFGCPYCTDKGEYSKKSVKFSIRYVLLKNN
jgi:hypothetical protein